MRTEMIKNKELNKIKSIDNIGDSSKINLRYKAKKKENSKNLEIYSKSFKLLNTQEHEGIQGSLREKKFKKSDISLVSSKSQLFKIF